MPGPALHHIIGDKIIDKLLYSNEYYTSLTNEEKQKIIDLLNDPKNLPYFYLGCQGPDFLFFNTKDWNGTLGDLAKATFDVYDAINGIIDDIKDAIPDEIWDTLAAIEDAADTVVESSVFFSELQQTFGDLNLVLTGLGQTLLEMVKEYISEFDLYDFFEHPYRDGVQNPDGKWWWFDSLHYRFTGKFAKALLEKTKDLDGPLHLYALGYLSHVTGDTVGHPYVNLVSGGPYRSHGQRHKTGENLQDVYNLYEHFNIDFNRSKLHTLYNFNYNGVEDTEENIPDSDTKMPEELSELILESISEVFNIRGDRAVEFGSEVTIDVIEDTYRLWYKWFKNTTETGILPEPVPYSFTAELREVWEKATDNLDSIGDFIEDAADTAGSIGGILGLLLFLAALIIAAVAAAAAIADAVLGGLLTLGTSTIRASLALIYEHVYNAYTTFRLGVALNGLAFPMIEHLNDPILSQFKRPDINDPTGTIADEIKDKLPLLRWDDHPEDDFEALTEAELGLEDHLIYPITISENNSVKGALASYLDKDSMYYVCGDIKISEGIIDQLLEISKEEDEESVLLSLMEKASLGNAVGLHSHLYDRFKMEQDIPDFNLDADRGYGYLCWTQTDGASVDNEEFPNALDVDNLDGPVTLKFINNG